MTETPRPLLLTRDSQLLDDVVRLAAAAGIEMRVSDQAGVSTWSSAPLVLVADDLLDTVATGALPRRDGVVVVCRSDDLESSPGMWRAAVALGAEHVAQLPDAERWVIDRLSQVHDTPTSGGPVISCVAGVGGAGASTVAALVARHGRGLLVDADPFGPAVPVEGGVRWPDLAATRGRIPPSSLRSALPSQHGAHVLTGTPEARFRIPPDALVAVLEAGSRGFPCTIVDTPRSDGESSRSAWARSDLVVVVVGPHPTASGRLFALVDAVRETCTQVVLMARTAARDGGTWCLADAHEIGIRALPAFRHDRALSHGDHAFLAPRSSGRVMARAVLSAAGVAS